VSRDWRNQAQSDTSSRMEIRHFFRLLSREDPQTRILERRLKAMAPGLGRLRVEFCFNVAFSRDRVGHDLEILRWLFAETFQKGAFSTESLLEAFGNEILEFGPRLNFTTAFSTNAVAICRSCGLEAVERIERSRRYLVPGLNQLPSHERRGILALLHDRMTECLYKERLESFDHGLIPEPVETVPLLSEGREALERLNRRMGLAFDDRDLEYYTSLFVDKLKRNPTTVECFDLAQSNSEHSRHWFFGGKLVIDGREMPRSLMEMIKEPLAVNPGNSVIAFRDNSSSIRGGKVVDLRPDEVSGPAPLHETGADFDLTLTAETHNFPSGVAPFPGAETGAGGRIRDGHATGRASLIGGGTAGYCVGRLHLPDNPLPWEEEEFSYPANLASPLEILIEASNGASDYGNKFGEPLIGGFTRSFGMKLPGGERREWIKPIMFSGGMGRMEHLHAEKGRPRPGMLVIKIGGPAYRIGMGGGAASSMFQGENAEELDFNAVQRGDAEMEQKVNRVIRACSELGEKNPIISIHDQGAGGNCNVLKELVDPSGGRIEIRRIPIGDDSLSVLEIWGAEYQENDALLITEENAGLFGEICRRERAPWAVVGHVGNDGRIRVHDSADDSYPVDMLLSDVLGKMPPKTFNLERIGRKGEDSPLLEEKPDVVEALERVLRLVSVGSKRFLVNKVDRAVTGLVARQQCVGPLHLPLSDVSVMAFSYFSKTGGATAIGEKPIVGLLDPAAMARLSLAEALTNIVFAPLSSLEDVHCSVNWMWAAKFPGEGAALYDAMVALKEAMIELGVAADGGKDSLSMAAAVQGPDGRAEKVKAPGALVVSAYAPCIDIAKVCTPDLKEPGRSEVFLVDLAPGKSRLGASALARVFDRIGSVPPDLDDPGLLKRAFGVIQGLVSDQLILSGHDRSDGGLIVCALEMAFAGNCGLEIDLESGGREMLALLFAEEPGMLLEVSDVSGREVLDRFHAAGVDCFRIGRSLVRDRIVLGVDGHLVLDEEMSRLRDVWEMTSFELEKLQASPDLVLKEREGLRLRKEPAWKLGFTPSIPRPVSGRKPRVAVLREEGSNSDREMAAAFHMAGFEPWDVNMSDLLEGRIGLDSFRGLVAVGGFSYADVLDSAKGWAGTIRFNTRLREQFERFFRREDTFSLGVCNGCQLFALAGWVPFDGLEGERQPRFIRNTSGRFESRFVTVRIEKSPAVMLRGMEDSVMGIWLQHGEGRAFFPDKEILGEILSKQLAPIRYADDRGNITEEYPFNPNGSPLGIAALCSPDGRHLAMMPHPERCFLPWQWPWMPLNWPGKEVSPWLEMFTNARNWCREED